MSLIKYSYLFSHPSLTIIVASNCVNDMIALQLVSSSGSKLPSVNNTFGLRVLGALFLKLWASKCL